MHIHVERCELFAIKADLAALPVWQDGFVLADVLERVPAPLRKAFARQAKAIGFTAGFGQAIAIAGGDEAHGTLLVLGLGAKADFSLELAREWTGLVVARARTMAAKTITLPLPGFDGDDVDVRALAEATTVALELADYTFDTFKKSLSEKRLKTATLVVAHGRDVNRVRKGVARAVAIVGGVSVARDLVNMPAQSMTPDHLAEAAERIAKAGGKQIRVNILDREQCTKLGMGAYLAVALGSDNPPRFIHLTYKPTRPTKKSVAIVGKGVTFDSGGLSLKPADGMMTMKCDMAGAASVLGLFATLTALQPRVEVHGIIAAVENMPSGKAIRPGDIVKASNGKTIEILNTDAEGRLTLADALHYAVGLDVDAVIDLATLTGACVVALGEEITGLMSNDDELAEKLLESAQDAGEKMWEMPLEKRYRSLIDSEIADLRNIPTSRYGGSLTAGLFLQEFVNEVPWAHLDIAGPAFAEKPMASYIGKGGTGHGIRTLVEYLERM